jgi:membrane-bound lytic murein transglycosylase D
MRFFAILVFLAAATGLAAEEPPPAKKPPATPPTDELYDLGKSLFDQYATPEIKAQYEFPSRERWDAFAGRLQQALDNNNLAELAAYEPEARSALTALRALPGYEDYADWLATRLDYIEAAKQAARLPAPLPLATPTTPGQAAQLIPYYDLWVRRIRVRPVPARAEELMPILRAAFVAEGVPPELAWLAEVESTLDPAARSPAGAKGLFQLMPETARALGLSTFLPDERTDAEKSAHAAARYLHALHAKFGEWPLAFAAYNAGEGRVQRMLTSHQARNFSDISAALPSETRMYVPKVCATIAVRTGMTPEKMSALRGIAASTMVAVDAAPGENPAGSY